MEVFLVVIKSRGEEHVPKRYQMFYCAGSLTKQKTVLPQIPIVPLLRNTRLGCESDGEKK